MTTPAAAVNASGEGRRLALVIGVNETSNSLLPPLKHAIADAEAMADVLETQCGFELLEPPLIGESATSERAKDAVRRLARKRNNEDFLLLYFSGHGQLMTVEAAQQDVYFVTSNFSEIDVEEDEDRHLSMRWLRDKLYIPTQAGKVLLILDCCYSGDVGGTVPDPYLEELKQRINYYFRAPGTESGVKIGGLRLALTATGPRARASEKDGKGLMTGLLLSALQGDVDDVLGKDGQISLERLFEYLRQAMPSDQPPSLSGDFAGRSCILAKNSKRAAEIHRTHTTPPALSGFPTNPSTLPSIWNIPYQRNPFFTGRDEILTQLHGMLSQSNTSSPIFPLAISGMGGVGKTQVAVEYAFRYCADYQAVLWAKANTREILASDFVALASLLHLPEQNTQEQSTTIGAVHQWLRVNTHWLLILDNADDLTTVRAFIPPVFGGHILLTTRAQMMGRIAYRIEIERMAIDEGTLFLLRRTGSIPRDAVLESAFDADREKTQEIVEIMDGLPLALDQAGAYIEETQCGLESYVDIYQSWHASLLNKRGVLNHDHPEPVATTWSLSFQQVEQNNKAASELLRFCAFLHPNAIPEEIFIEGAVHLGPLLQNVAADAIKFNEAVKELLRFFLMRRDPDTKTLSMHPLVQTVLKDAMDETMYRQWAERAVRAVNEVFPDSSALTWSRCQRYLPNAQICAKIIEQENITLPEAVRLLSNVARYLQDRALYPLAEPLYQQAVTVSKQVWGTDSSDTAWSLTNLVGLWRFQGKYAQAEPLAEQALAIREQQLGAEHLDTAQSLHDLAAVYYAQGKYKLAEPLYQKVLRIREQQLGPEHPDAISSLNNLALLYQSEGKYAQAESLYQRALAFREQQLGPSHQHIAISLNNLAVLYQLQKKYMQAEPFYQRALAIYELTIGSDDTNLMKLMSNYTSLLRQMKRDTEATILATRIKAMRIKRSS